MKFFLHNHQLFPVVDVQCPFHFLHGGGRTILKYGWRALNYTLLGKGVESRPLVG